ncbi:MAG: type II secretion system protein, partial [bacterium]|nr:type II secretion system protein [bacterium]
MIKKLLNLNKGFTLVELMISVAIFAFMTAFLVAKYGTFNQGILLTNLAYDVALTIRNAQSYGLNVKSRPVSGGASFSSEFTYPYGVRFDRSSLNKAKVVFFVDANLNGAYDEPDEEISTSNIKRGSYISGLCMGSGGCTYANNIDVLDITFKRPDPNAIIKGKYSGSVVAGNQTYAEITL